MKLKINIHRNDRPIPPHCDGKCPHLTADEEGGSCKLFDATLEPAKKRHNVLNQDYQCCKDCNRVAIDVSREVRS